MQPRQILLVATPRTRYSNSSTARQRGRRPPPSLHCTPSPHSVHTSAPHQLSVLPLLHHCVFDVQRREAVPDVRLSLGHSVSSILFHPQAMPHSNPFPPCRHRTDEEYHHMQRGYQVVSFFPVHDVILPTFLIQFALPSLNDSGEPHVLKREMRATSHPLSSTSSTRAHSPPPPPFLLQPPCLRRERGA